jgi:hypothetical protein
MLTFEYFEWSLCYERRLSKGAKHLHGERGHLLIIDRIPNKQRREKRNTFSANEISDACKTHSVNSTGSLLVCCEKGNM